MASWWIGGQGHTEADTEGHEPTCGHKGLVSQSLFTLVHQDDSAGSAKVRAMVTGSVKQGSVAHVHVVRPAGKVH